jgi:hypothetical protein
VATGRRRARAAARFDPVNTRLDENSSAMNCLAPAWPPAEFPFQNCYTASLRASFVRYKVRLSSFRQKKKIDEGMRDVYENPDCLQ